MSVTVRRHATAGNYRIPSPGQEFTCTDVYSVTWTGNPAAAPDDGTIILDAIAAGLPAIQSRYPSCDQNLGMLVCQSHDWRKLPGCSTAWTVTVTWGTYANFLNLTGEGADTEPFTRVTRVGSLRTTPAYRLGIAPPSSPAWPPLVDVGGTKVDINGQPMPLSVPQMQITVEWMYDRTTTDSVQGGEPEGAYWNYLGARNDSAFLGFGTGTLLLTGINASPLNDQWYMMQFTMLWDYWKHCEQRSAPNIGGLSFLATTANFIGVPIKQCTKIGWLQPYPDVLDFADLFPPDVLDAIETFAPTAEPYVGCVSAGRDFTGMQVP